MFPRNPRRKVKKGGPTMFVQKVPHIKDQFLTQERASMELESGQIAVGWYTNEQDSQSVVHSHPYYELVLPLVGSNVR